MLERLAQSEKRKQNCLRIKARNTFLGHLVKKPGTRVRRIARKKKCLQTGEREQKGDRNTGLFYVAWGKGKKTCRGKEEESETRLPHFGGGGGQGKTEKGLLAKGIQKEDGGTDVQLIPIYSEGEGKTHSEVA